MQECRLDIYSIASCCKPTHEVAQLRAFASNSDSMQMHAFMRVRAIAVAIYGHGEMLGFRPGPFFLIEAALHKIKNEI